MINNPCKAFPFTYFSILLRKTANKIPANKIGKMASDKKNYTVRHGVAAKVSESRVLECISDSVVHQCGQVPARGTRDHLWEERGRRRRQTRDHHRPQQFVQQFVRVALLSAGRCPAGRRRWGFGWHLGDDGVLRLSAPLPHPKLNLQTVFSGLPHKSKKEKKISSK